MASVPYKNTLPPLNVSPFIRGCRYIALTAGIFYGAINYKRLSKKEARFREVTRQKWEAEAPLRLAKKQKADLENNLVLQKEFGIPLPPAEK